MSSWTSLGSLPPRDLTEARLEMHHALQLVSIAVGRALVPHRDDDSHTAVTWLEGARLWVGEEIPGSGGVRAGLRPADLTLTLGRAAQPGARRRSLSGRTLDDGLAWLKEQLVDIGVSTDAVALDFHYEMPAHPVAEGARFRTDLDAGFEEIARYFASGIPLLDEARRDHEGATALLTWPHHFDAGLLIPAGTGDDAFGKGVGVGLSAGDESYPEPYFYVNAWPRPEDAVRPELPRGHWHTEGFFAAVLTATDLLEGSEEGQEARAREFLAAAIAAARGLVA